MITNTREYQITRTQLARLKSALSAAKEKPPVEGVHPTIHAAELTALESEVENLKHEVQAYEDLLEGRRIRFETTGLQDLPELLIQARIASRLTQKQVADRLGIHEQQVQRYEANTYRGVSFDRLLEIAQLLGVHVEQNVVLAAPLLKNARANLNKLGFTNEFIDTRVLSLDREDAANHPSAAISAAERLGHIFGWSLEQLGSSALPRIARSALGGALFKLPAGRNGLYLEAYTAYAYRIACGAARCAQELPHRSIPSDWREARRQILGIGHGQMTLARVIDWAWELGVVVIPLVDRAAFNGAFWRIKRRNVIIIKQKTASPERLIHDALHEIYHASQEPDLPDRAVLEQLERPARTDTEDISANTFASDVLLNGSANELVEEVAREARSHGPALKSAVQQVAYRRHVAVGALANHLAWVLERQSPPLNWWGTAQNLQGNASSDFEYARTIAFNRLAPSGDNDIDVELLFRALRAAEES